MSLNNCPFCEHGNPADARFCSACGGALHLVPCPRCGAVSDVAATTCYQCHGQLRGRGTEALETESPAAEVSRPFVRRHARLMVGTAVLAAIAVLGYFSYGQRSLVNPLQSAATGSEPGRSGPTAGAGVVRRNATAGDTTSAKPPDSTPPGSEISPAEAPLAETARATADPPRAGRQPVESREGKAAAAPVARPRATGADKAGRRESFRPEVCTEAVAALGLCSLKPVQSKEAETASAINATVRPAATDAGKAVGQVRARTAACTEAEAALGLCTPGSTPRRE